jgi:hypothetical protein
MTSTTAPSTPTGKPAVDRTGIWKISGVAAVGAAVANVAVALAARAADVSLEVTQMGGDQREEIPIVMFAVASVIGALIGGGIAQALARRSGAARTFTIVGVVGAVLSMVSPIAADADGGTKWVLAITHVVAAVIIVPLLARKLRR